MALVCTSTRDIISEYNSRTKRIFPVRCGGFDHEHHMFWTTYKRERAAELSSLSSQADKRMIQAIDPLHPQRSTMKIQTTTGPRRFHLQATIQIPIPRPPTQTPTTIQTPDSPRPQRSTANRHNLRSPFIVSEVRLFEPAPLDWPMSQPNPHNLDIAHHVAITHP